MHTGSRAFCFLIALAATGSEAASASSPTTSTSVANAPVPSGHYLVEAKIVSVSPAVASDIRDEASSGHVSTEALAKLIANPKASTFSFPTVEVAESHTASIHIGELNPKDDSQQRDTYLTLVPEDKNSKPGFSLRFARLRPVDFVDQAGRPTFDTIKADLAADSADGYWYFNIPSATVSYDADGRRKASIADANERQLLFVKITRG